MRILTTSAAIRLALRDDYRALINKYDRKTAERRVTEKAARDLRPYRCAVCGRVPPDVLRLEAAHISPLAECATTAPKNLVLLCREAKKRSEDLGCHKLFDDGFCSINTIERCKFQGGVHQNIRGQMLAACARRKAGAQQRGELRKALADLREEQGNLNQGTQEWFELQIRIAELTRRRTTKDALALALCEFNKVYPASLESPILKSKFYYGRGYVHLLAGELEQAFSDFKVGREMIGTHLSDPRCRWRWAAHTVLMEQVSCVMRVVHPRSRWSWNAVHKKLFEALRQAKLAAKSLAVSAEHTDELRLARGWVQNCTIILATPALAMSDFSGAMRWWRKSYLAWRDMDLSSGWDVAARATSLSLYGRIVLGEGSPKQASEAMPYLVRALVLLVGRRRQQPEGIRELLFAIAKGVRAHAAFTLSKRLERIADRCKDFSSWIHPYVPS